MLPQHLVGVASQQQKLQPQLLQPHQDYDQLGQHCNKKRQEIHVVIVVVIIAVESKESNNKQTGGLQTLLKRSSLPCYVL